MDEGAEHRSSESKLRARLGALGNQGGLISVLGSIDEVKLPFLLDSGASHNFLSHNLVVNHPRLQTLVTGAKSSVNLADGRKAVTWGSIQDIEIKLEGLPPTAQTCRMLWILPTVFV